MDASTSVHRFREALAEILKRGVTDDEGGVLVPCDPAVDRVVHVLVHEFHPSTLEPRKGGGWVSRYFDPEPETPAYFAKLTYKGVEWKPGGAYFTPEAIKCAKLAAEYDDNPYLSSRSIPEVDCSTLSKAAEAKHIRRRKPSGEREWLYCVADVRGRWPDKFSGQS